MAMFMAVLVFGAALTVAVWAMYATVKPELARIRDLLIHGPVLSPAPARHMAVRSIVRDVRVSQVRSLALLRAAA
jgi:hypothetical protein